MSAISGSKQSTIAFFVLAYLITWAFWIPFVIFGPSSSAIVLNPDLRGSPFMLLQVLGNFGPTLAAAVLLAFSGKRGELRGAFNRLLPHRTGLLWYIVVLLLPLGTLLPGLFISTLLGGNIAQFNISSLLLMFIPAIFISGLGEEMGWRGFALSRLQIKKTPFLASLIVGVFWGLWHLPIIYWFSSQTGLFFIVEFILYIVQITAFSVIFAWVYNAMKNRLWMIVLMHAAFTASGNTIAVFTQPLTGGTWIPYIVNVLSAVGVAALVVALNKNKMLSRQDAT
jgi:membrane protease YdiL (CAAX protease family)